MKIKFTFLLLACLFNLNAQTLTISSSGEDGTSTRTNWSISGTTLTVTGTANIRASVIANALASGSLSVVGNTATFNVTISESITATGNNLLTVASATNTGTITVNAGISLGGAAIFNSNAFALGDGINISTSTASAITINTNLNFSTSGTTRRTISSEGGDIIIHADKDANGSGVLDLDYLTINPGVGNIIIRGETVSFLVGSGQMPYINGTGSFTFESSDVSFGQLMQTIWFFIDQDANGISGLTIGKPGNTADIEVNTNISIAGPISVMGGDVLLNGNITSTATGDLFFQGLSNIWSVRLAAGKTIEKTSGMGLLTMQGNGRINNSTSVGSILASGSARLDVVIINEMDAGTAGVYNVSTGNITTNGGHLWISAGAKTRIWNGLSVGSTGVPGNTNYNGIDVTGNVSTNGGDIFLWAFVGSAARSNGYGDITALSSNRTISSGSGDITLMTRYNDFVDGAPDISISTTGTLTLAPASGSSFDVGLSYAGTTASGTFIGSGGMDGLIIQNVSNLSGLVIGSYNGTGVSGDSPYTSANTADVTLGSAISIAGPISVYGDNIFAQQNLTSTASGAAILMQAIGYINVSASDTIQTNNGNITLRANASGTAAVVPNSTTGAITLNNSSSLLSNGGNITLGGNFDGTKGSGLYAASARVGGAPGVLISGATINAAGGNINIYGRCSTSYDDGIRLQATITTTGSGSIGIYGDAFGGLTAGAPDVWFGGITFITNPSTIETENGNINIEGVLTNTQSNGTYALNFYRTAASGTNARDIQIISKTGNIQITGDRGTTSAGGMGHSSWGDIYVGSPLSGSWTASGQIKFSYSSFVGAGIKGFKVKTIGAVIYEPSASSFVNAQTFPYNSNYIVAENASSLTIGKPSNTSNITCEAVQNVSGPIQIYGGDISINENLNTVAGASVGSVLIKGSGDVILAATKSIATSGAPVILWANSDNGATNGSIALRNGSSIITGSNSVPGGHVWIGGGSDGTAWNGLAVGSGYAVPGTSFTPSNGGGSLQSGIYLERNSISSFGGNIKIAGDGAAAARGIISYGSTININAGNGKIDIDGQVTSSAAGNRGGILFGLHDVSIASTINIISAATSGDAITINGVGRGTEDAIGLSGTLNITSSGGGNIVMNGNALGSGRSIVAGNYYHGILNIFANTGNISLNGNTKAIQVSAAILSGSTAGPSKINIGQGGTITNSSSDVFMTSDNIALAAGGIAINTAGEVTVEPSSASFSSAVSFPISNLSLANTITGLTLGKSTNTANITFGAATSIAGPITAYGGNITINQNLTSTASGEDILLKASGDIVLNTGRTITTSAGDVLLWANSDGETSNGGVFLDAASSIATTGGHVWIGGSSTSGGSITWNGLTVGNGYATSGRDLTPFQNEGSAIDWDAGVLLDETTINSGGGNIYIAGRRSVSPNSRGGAGVINYSGTNGTLINSGSGTITILGETSIDLSFSDFGIMTGLHPGNYTGKLTIQSANTSSATAISITASTVTAEAGLLVEDHTRILSTATSGGGGISMSLSSGTGSALQVGIGGNSGTLDLLSASGAIAVDGGSDAITVPVTVGTFRIGSISGDANVPSSTANVTLTSNTISLAGTVPIVTTGSLTIAPTTGNSFTSTFSTAVLNYTGITGLTIGRSSNTANVTFGSTTTIAGPITAYGGTIAINENLTSSNGSPISLFGNALTFGTNKTITSNNGQLIIAPQNASNTIGLGGATGTLSLPASYFSTHFSDGFSNIQIGSNSQTGNMTTNAFTLRDNMTFLTTGSLTLGGRPVLGSNNLTLGSAISSISAGPSGYFQTNGTGKVMSTLANNASTLYPVGNAYYNGVTITNKTNATDIFSVIIKDSVLGNGDTGRQITTPHVRATWDISKTNANAGSGVDFVFSWDTAQERGGINNFILNHHNGTVWKIAAGTRGTVSGTSTKTITHTGYNGSFSPFAFGNSGTPLPVELIAFNAQCLNEFIQIDWTTASEKNNKMFELYKSDNAIDWSLIHTADGQGDKATETSYQFIDYKKQPAYYRLKDIDFDGMENWSPIIFADCKNDVSDIQVYPNPASDFIKVVAPISENATLRIINLEGKIIKTLSLISNQTLVSVRDLNAGIYMIEIEEKGSTDVIKFIKY